MKPASIRGCQNAVQTRRHILTALSPHSPSRSPLPFLIPSLRNPPPHSPSRTAPCRRFSQQTSLQRPIAVRNPVFNEKGEELVLSISDRAAKRLSQISESDSSTKGPQLLRINVEAGGCHGFQYLMSLEREAPPPSTSASPSSSSSPSPTSTTITSSSPPPPSPPSAPADDTTPPDTIIASPTHPSARIVLDTPSLELLAGSTVDYTKELIGAQFKIVGNPRATSSCGCGTSFDVVEGL